MSAYYNEIEPKAAAWLRELIKEGHIADGVVDERNIKDVRPDELFGFTQCHFFAGIGVWSHALRLAGWPDDRPVWTGSLPCQPFSSAGKRKGTQDERHLWPIFHELIEECGPRTVMGEQVASGIATGKYRGPGVEALWKKDLALCHLLNSVEDGYYRQTLRRMFLENRARLERGSGYSWLDALQNDLEGVGYACGSAVTAACGFGSPQQRKRLYWMAHPEHYDGRTEVEGGRKERRVIDGGRGSDGVVEDTICVRRQTGGDAETRQEGGSPQLGKRGEPCIVADADIDRQRPRGESAGEAQSGDESGADACGCGEPSGVAHSKRPRSQGGLQGGKDSEGQDIDGHSGCDRTAIDPGPTNGFWGDVDWLGCRDGKWRPVETGTFPLVDGAKERVGLLRGYGNAIVAQQAQAFIEALA